MNVRPIVQKLQPMLGKLQRVSPGLTSEVVESINNVLYYYDPESLAVGLDARASYVNLLAVQVLFLLGDIYNLIVEGHFTQIPKVSSGLKTVATRLGWLSTKPLR